MKSILTFISLTLPLFALCQLKINEFSPKGELTDYNQQSDWVELMNIGDEPILLSEYYISDDSADLLQWQLPAEMLNPGDIIVIAASGENLIDYAGNWQSLVLAQHTWAYLPGTEEPDENWNQLDFVDDDWSIGQGGFGFSDGDDGTEISGVNTVYLRKSFDLLNLDELEGIVFHADYDDAYVAYVNGVEISRSDNIVGENPPFDAEIDDDHEAQLYQGEYPDEHYFDVLEASELLIEGENVLAIQLHNNSIWSSDMSGNFFLSVDIVGFDTVYDPIPDWFVPQQSNFYCHSNFKLSAGETVFLSTENSVVDEQLIPEDLTTGLSFGRSPDGTGEWCYFDVATPELTNGDSWCYNGVAAPPTVSLPSGWYEGEQIVSASMEEGVIRYSTNGDKPSVDSPEFSSMNIDENTALSLRFFPSGNLIPSPVADYTYFLEEDNHNLPVFSVHTDEANLWDWDEGIYVFGPNANTTEYPYFGSNFWEPWSKLSRLEYFNADKELTAQEQFDLEIHGGWSRAENQKSFRLDFKSIYSGRLEIPLFSQKPEIENVNNINLRTGGQHLWEDKIMDGIVSRVVNDMHLDNMAYEPCLLYLNGEFWGVYGIREKVDKHYIESNHGVESDELDLLNSFGVLEGSNDDFMESFNLITNEPSNSDEFYDLADSRFDLENYMDYFIVETYIQNLDWMGIAWGANNIKLWRDQNEGKWRYVLYDTDGSFGFFWGNVTDNYIDLARSPVSPSEHSVLFDKMLENDQFKCEFAMRYADLMNTAFQPEAFAEKANEIVAQIDGAMPMHTDRWAESVSYSQWLEEVDGIVEYNSNRLSHARSHVNSSLDLGGEVTISLEVIPEGAGQISISTITPEEYPWTGIYYNGCPVEIVAIPNEGFEFEFWSENEILGAQSLDSELFTNLPQSGVFTANFSSEGDFVNEVTISPVLEIFPNPSTGEVNLIYTSGQLSDISINIIDAVGKIVESTGMKKYQQTISQKIDLSLYEQGLYHIEVINEHGFISKKVALVK